jgi:hypothetical protein
MSSTPLNPATQEDDPVARRTGGVAVVVIHGVADQRPGETLKSVVELMTAASPPGVRYTATDSLDFAIHVDPMGPHPRDAFDGPAPAAHTLVAAGPGAATPDGRKRHWVKSLLQSFKSDFHRPPDASDDPVDVSWAVRRARARLADRQAAQAVARESAGVEAVLCPAKTPVDHTGTRADRGLQFTAYLLTKALRNRAPSEDYATRRTRMTRHGATETTQVDLYEMYWADLSRLAGSVPAIVSELFTLIFRLSNLGRDTVAEACHYASANRTAPNRRWRALSFCQALLDWSFTNILAQLFAQLLLVGALILLFGLATPDSAPDTASGNAIRPYLRAAGVVFIILAFGIATYFVRAGARWRPIGVAVWLVQIGISMLVVPDSPWAYAFTLIVALSVAYDWMLRAADERFPFVLVAGRFLWTGLVAWMGWHILFAPTDGTAWDRVLHGTLAGFELLLLLIKWWWIVAAAVIVVWAALSISTARRPYDQRASAATGRLATLVSFAVFIATTMSLWAVLETPVEKAIETSRYDPVIWTTQPALSIAEMQARSAADPSFCYADHLAHPFANVFLGCRFDASTAMFASVAVLLVLILGYLILTVLPSVLAELSWTRSQQKGADQRLGLWLTSLYRWLDGMVLVVTLVGAVAVVGFAIDAWTQDVSDPFSVPVTRYSRDALHYLIFPATTAFAALSAFGRYLSRTVPGLRGPLDAALDVDNYFREFPRTRIPRARIFSRYRALMRHLRDQGYDRVVIVSHSQGTVISAEFLRFISSESTDNRRHDRQPRLRELMGCEVRLLTLGCPLRQLYATRFPTYYQWVLDQSGDVNGPHAADIGVEVWANAFGSGDYVGRWLWSAAATPPDGFHPMLDRIAPDAHFGRQSVYQPFAAIPLPHGALGHRRYYETCTGFGAHTHYFDLPATSQPKDRSIVAYLIDELIAGDHVVPAAPATAASA